MDQHGIYRSQTSLHRAALMVEADILHILLSQGSIVNIDVLNAEGRSPSHLAVMIFHLQHNEGLDRKRS